MLGPLANTLQSGASLILADPGGVGNETGNWLAVSSDDDLLASLHPVQQGSEPVLGFKRPNLQHNLPQFIKLAQSSLLRDLCKVPSARLMVTSVL